MAKCHTERPEQPEDSLQLVQQIHGYEKTYENDISNWIVTDGGNHQVHTKKLWLWCSKILEMTKKTVMAGQL